MKWILLTLLVSLPAPRPSAAEDDPGRGTFDGGVVPGSVTTGTPAPGTPGATTPGHPPGHPPSIGAGRPVPQPQSALGAETKGAGGGEHGGDVCRNFIGCPMKCSQEGGGDKKQGAPGGSSASMELGGPGLWVSSVLLARLASRRRRKGRPPA